MPSLLTDHKHLAIAGHEDVDGKLSASIAIWSLVVMLTATFMLSDARSQTLEEALAAAYLSNPTIEAQRAAVRATDELVPQALSDWRPNVTLQSSVQTSDINSSATDGSLTGTSSALILEQNLYQGGETTANIARAERLVRLERARPDVDRAGCPVQRR